MSPLEVAARFAAFTWYTNMRSARGRTSHQEGQKFAQENWRTFVPVANEGLGRRLLRVAHTRKPSRASSKKRSAKRELATAS